MFTGQMFTGCGTAMVTPFRLDGTLDEATLIRLIHRQIDAGIDLTRGGFILENRK
jgi:dihydrodipicolinate synthase/N-acetylneuraminate lyase